MTDQDLLFQAAHALITAYDCIDGEDEKQVAEKAIEALLDRLATVDLAKVGEIGVWGYGENNAV